MWIGDFNIAPKGENLLYAVYFWQQKGSFYRRCNRYQSVTPREAVCVENIGQPRIIDGEQKRFGATLEADRLVDTYCETQKLRDDRQEDEERTDEKKAIVTYCNKVTRKLGDKGMCIDHCVVMRASPARMRPVFILARDVDVLHVFKQNSTSVGWLWSAVEGGSKRSTGMRQ